MNLRDMGFAALVAILGTSGCGGQQSESRKSVRHGNLTGDEISRLKIGETVEFPAVIGRLSGNNCLEAFVPDEYEKYNGDGKWSVSSRLGTPVSSSGLSEGKRVVVVGSMARIKDSEDPVKTCGIVTGNLFEISAIR